MLDEIYICDNCKKEERRHEHHKPEGWQRYWISKEGVASPQVPVRDIWICGECLGKEQKEDITAWGVFKRICNIK